jgi:DNA-binding transcriptional MocR family regulator
MAFLARAARVQGHDANSYTVPKGELRLRQEIARRAMRWGQALSPEDIVITCGCTEALTLALKAVTRPGDAVAIESPTYFGILQILEALDLRALELPTDATTGIELAALHDALTRRTIAACCRQALISRWGARCPTRRSWRCWICWGNTGCR